MTATARGLAAGYDPQHLAGAGRDAELRVDPVEVGADGAVRAISTPLLFAANLGMAAVVCLWWLYFDMTSLAASTGSSKRAGRPGSTWPSRPIRT
ncbi:low temperature requirement protein A [Dactylosporangium sp. NBC_01737]|uniref:hypothetical protein n=1 Tax=Dactylosporangium sp. NBC_01737 TaxID=2975959 RepID=UPI002E0F758D|nr:low temperature requirement protein A [Dactylosporangium sp. NBC_01737]